MTSQPQQAIQRTPIPADGSTIYIGKSQRRPLRFPTQRPDEHVILLLRRHWSVIAKHIVHITILLVIPPAVLTFLVLYTELVFVPGTPLYILIVEGLSLYYLFAFLSYFHHFIDYHLDIWVVTDERIVSIEQEGLFNRVVSELNITRVQDVTSEMKGKIQTFLHYGQVHIQTAGEAQRFVFEEVPHPDEIARIILQVHDRVGKKEELEKVREGEMYRHQIENQPVGQQPGQPQPPIQPTNQS